MGGKEDISGSWTEMQGNGLCGKLTHVAMDVAEISHVFFGEPWIVTRKQRKRESSTTLHLDYAYRAFLLLHEDLAKQGYSPNRPHLLRRQFWDLLLKRRFSPIEAQNWVHIYAERVEAELAEIIRTHSLAYWIHVYRRLSPGAIGRDQKPETVLITREVLEAAFQKYARLTPCQGLELSTDVPIERVLGGMLLAPEFAAERKLLETPYLILTDFGPTELREVYELERLAYELWRCGALLRITAKGAWLIVDDSDECMYDDRTDELDELVRSFDQRHDDSVPLSAVGLVRSSLEGSIGHSILVPVYNVTKIRYSQVAPLYNALVDMRVSGLADGYPNFVWNPFALAEYTIAHKPFASEFRKLHGVSLNAVLTVVAALHYVLLDKLAENPHVLVRLSQRGYYGPVYRQGLLARLLQFKPAAIGLLGLEDDVPDADYIEAINFWTLDHQSQSNIGLRFPGPHSILLPYGDDYVLINYEAIPRRLHYMFIGVNISNQNFKADMLEELVRGKSSALPSRPCKGLDNSSKQVDAAFAVGSTLVIVECKAVGQSAGFFQGQPDSLSHRIRNIDEALRQVDEKAKWLATHPKGRNYEIGSYSQILPIVVTPFTEYIPKLDSHYWVKAGVPRVLTPRELKTLLVELQADNRAADSTLHNRVAVPGAAAES